MNPIISEGIWYHDDDLAYLAALVLRLEHPHPKFVTEESKAFTKALILIASGITIPGFNICQIPQFEASLKDFTENFKQLYPQYFNNINPAFQQIVNTITLQNHACNYH